MALLTSVCVVTDRVKKISQTHSNQMQYTCLESYRKENQETQDNSAEMDLDRRLPGYGQFQDSTYVTRMAIRCLFC